MTISQWLDLVWVLDMVALATVGLFLLAWLLGCGLAVMATWGREWRDAREAEAREAATVREEWL